MSFPSRCSPARRRPAARLAARLTGYKIDIKPASQAAEFEAQQEAPEEPAMEAETEPEAAEETEE